MLVLDHYPGDDQINKFTKTPQIFIDNYNNITGTVKLPNCTIPFI